MSDMEKFRDSFKGKELICIAEIGLNHNGDYETAARMIEAAHNAGADAVKFQTIVPEQMYSVYTTSLLRDGCESEPDMSQIEFFRKFLLSENEYRALKSLAESFNMVFFSSPFDGDSVNMLEALDAPIYKVASSELTNHALLRLIGKTAKPVLMSTGISTEDEIGAALETLRFAGSPDIVLLHCVSLYPLPPEKANLARIAALSRRFNIETGFSDHSPDGRIAELAAAAGARIFEKHFKLADDFECPDGAVSLAPEAFRKMRESLAMTVMYMGDGHISFDSSEKEVANSARKSLFSRCFIPKGSILKEEHVIAKRPGIGIQAYSLGDIAGKTSNRDIPPDYMLRNEFFD